MKKIKIAQIGIGHDHAASNFYALTTELTDIFEVVGYAKVPSETIIPDTEKWGYTYGNEISYDKVLSMPDLDAVIIETFDLELVKYAQIFADKGLHVFMDKPGSESTYDFEKMLSTIKNNGKVFGIGYMYRYNPAVKETLESIRQGKLGEIYAVEAQMSCDHNTVKRNWLGAFNGGMTFFLGCHLVDMIYTFLGVPEEIIPYNTCTGMFGVTAKDYGLVLFRYKNGVSFLKTSACEIGGFERRQLVVCGSQGTVEIKPFEWEQKNFRITTTKREIYREQPEVRTNWHTKGEVKESEHYCRYTGMLIDFASKIRNGKMADEDFIREARVHRLVLASCGIKCDYKGEIKL
jgi:predicted dehydrogenase